MVVGMKVRLLTDLIVIGGGYVDREGMVKEVVLPPYPNCKRRTQFIFVELVDGEVVGVHPKDLEVM